MGRPKSTNAIDVAGASGCPLLMLLAVRGRSELCFGIAARCFSTCSTKGNFFITQRPVVLPGFSRESFLNLSTIPNARPRPLLVRRVDVNFAYPLGYESPSSVDPEGFRASIEAAALHLRSSVEFFQDLFEDLQSAHGTKHGLLTRFHTYVPRIQGNELKDAAFACFGPASAYSSWNRGQHLLTGWTTTWTHQRRIANRVQNLQIDISTDHLLAPREALYPYNEAAFSDFLEGNFMKTNSDILSAFSTVHPVYKLHADIFNVWKSFSGSISKELGEILIQAFDLSKQHPVTSSMSIARIGVTEGNVLYVERSHKHPTNTMAKQSESLTLDGYKRMERLKSARASMVSTTSRRAYIGLGSNQGDSIESIGESCNRLNQSGISIQRTSSLYETSPMYMKEQNNFFNAVCEVETSLTPDGLLQRLKEIENDLGRVKTIDNGPRPIDLDILLYDGKTVDSKGLIIPHPRMHEREFVLRPLCDLVPNAGLPTLHSHRSFSDMLEVLAPREPSFLPRTILSSRAPQLIGQRSDKPTSVMAVVNMTPDSFSNGRKQPLRGLEPLINDLKHQMKQKHPLTILDIGGQSTRPRAPPVSYEEESSRILPFIKAIRADQALNHLTISVDTYRAAVAEAAIRAGSDLINDVSAGQMDPAMLPTIARLGCSCILMHMRGTPDTMMKLTDYPSGIIEGVGSELLARVREAEKAGIRRWRIILDPGIGFAKTQAQNLELLRRFKELRDFEGLRGFPWVVGASRKAFIGKITGVEEASERKWGTAACVVAAIQGGADIVRVHDVEEMGQVVGMADAIWRV